MLSLLYPSALLTKRQTLLLLLCILAVAATLRFAALGSIPSGVWLDEALKGIEGIESVRTGHFQIFYPANNGREGLWIAVIGYSESVFGVNQFGLRFASALVGTLTVLFVFLLARGFYSDRVALLAAWFTATGFWHVLFSRLAFRGILVPFLLTASIYFLVRAEKKLDDSASRKFDAWSLAILGGVFFGLGFHSYIAFRVTPLLIVIIFVCELMRRRRLNLPSAPWLKILAAWLLIALLVALPIGIYFLHHPQDFEGRAKEVSIFTDKHPARLEVKVLLRTLGMFNFHGDKNWRHNYGGRPELLAPVGIFFLAGIWIAVARVRRAGWRTREEWWLLAWFAVLLIPELLSAEGTPHALRSIGVIPPVYIFAALGADFLWSIVAQRKPALSLAMLAFVIAIGGYDAWKYFHDYARHGALTGNQSFNQLQAAEGAFLNSLPSNPPRIVVYEDAPQLEDARLPSFGRVDYKLPMDAEPLIFATYDRPVTLVSLQDEIKALDSGLRIPDGAVIIPLEGRLQMMEKLREHGATLDLHQQGSVIYGTSR